MINPINTAKIFSTLGNNSSLIPLGIKDISNTLGMTAGSYATGSNVEGKDRFIDEFGTQIIWLLGIPFFKKVIDKTVYKLAKINPDIDTRLLKNKDIFQKAKDHALPGLKESFERIESKQKLFKGLAFAKFAVSTALTLASYSALTTFRHKHTEKAIIEEFKAEEEKKKQAEVSFESKTDKKQKQPSFGANMSLINQFMFDPVKNTMIVDGGITTERLAESRNPQDLMGYVIKEGGFWAFMYFLGPAIQKHMENKAAKSHKPIDLDIRVLQDKMFMGAIKDDSIQKHLNALPKEFSEYQSHLPKKGDSKEILKTKAAAREKLEPQIYESLFSNGDNMIVKMAKKAELIKTVKGTETIDSQHYIDIESVVDIKGKVENLYKECKASKGGADDFFKHIIKLKRASIIKNIGYSVGALGIIVPGIMVAMRFMDKDNKEFQVKKEIHEKLKKQKNFA